MPTPAIRPLTSPLQVIACKELFEETEYIQENLDSLKAWMQKSGHIKGRTDDQFLIAFLRGCKYSLERAKKKIDMFYTVRTHFPEVLKDRDPMDRKLLEIIKLGVILPLPVLEKPDSPRLMLIRLGAYDANKCSIQDVMKVFTMIQDILMLEDDNMVVAGQIYVGDLANVTFTHFVQMQPTFLKKIAIMLMEGSPIRQKSFNYINSPKIFDQVFSIFKSFLNDKMRSRLFVHSSMDSFQKIVPQRIMPSEYNGEAGSLQSLTEVWEKKILSYRQYLLDESKLYGVDEKRRVGASKNSNSLFGLEGTFKQLQLD